MIARRIGTERQCRDRQDREWLEEVHLAGRRLIPVVQPEVRVGHIEVVQAVGVHAHRDPVEVEVLLPQAVVPEDKY